MKYMLLMYSTESAMATMTPEQMKEIGQDAWFALIKEARDAGVLVDTNGLLSISNASTVRVRDGKTLITDGPFAETHEQLGGYFMVDCKDLDEALVWAAKIPTAKFGSIEVRPLWSGAQ